MAVRYHYGKFPPKNIKWDKLIPFIGPANASIARYSGILDVIPNPDVLLSPLSTQDAVLSSRIEGTQATMGEVLEYEALGEEERFTPERRNDIQEILNYRKAMHHAIRMMDSLPLCQRVIKEMHAVLLDSVRGENKSPGEYRKIANWIGPPGCTKDEAFYIPVTVEKIKASMTEWEKYINSEQPDILVQLAIIHAEFEAIHPFLDGNGRLGRMVVPLFLYQKKIIQSPTFYISAYFEQNRDEYYQRLNFVSKNDDWTGWSIFFLQALIEQAEENITKVFRILDYYNKLKDDVPQMTRSQYAIQSIDWIFSQPVFKTSDFIESSGIPQATARRILDILRKNNIIKSVKEASGRRSGTYMLHTLLNIVEGYNLF